MKKKVTISRIIRKQKKCSARKTAVRKLNSFGFLKFNIKSITIYSSERGLDAYDSGNEDEMFAMPSTISKSKYSTLNIVKKKLTRRHHQNNLNLIFPGIFIQHCRQKQLFFRHKSECFLTVPTKQVSWNFFTKYFSFNECQVNININKSILPQRNNNVKSKNDTSSTFIQKNPKTN